MDIRKTRTCERCRNSVPLDQVRIHPKPDGKTMMLCEKCSREVQRKVPEPLTKVKTITALPAAEFVTLLCRRCNYAFRADQSKAGVLHRLHCPYCGKSDQLKKQ